MTKQQSFQKVRMMADVLELRNNPVSYY